MKWRTRTLRAYGRWAVGNGPDYKTLRNSLAPQYVKNHNALLLFLRLVNMVPEIDMSRYQYNVMHAVFAYAVVIMYHEHRDQLDNIFTLYNVSPDDVSKPYIKSVSYRQAGKSTIMILICMAFFMSVPLHVGWNFEQCWVSFNLDVVKRALTLMKSRMRLIDDFYELFSFDDKESKETHRNGEKKLRMRRKDDPDECYREVELMAVSKHDLAAAT